MKESGAAQSVGRVRKASGLGWSAGRRPSICTRRSAGSASLRQLPRSPLWEASQGTPQRLSQARAEGLGDVGGLQGEVGAGRVGVDAASKTSGWPKGEAPSAIAVPAAGSRLKRPKRRGGPRPALSPPPCRPGRGRGSSPPTGSLKGRGARRREAERRAEQRRRRGVERAGPAAGRCAASRRSASPPPWSRPSGEIERVGVGAGVGRRLPAVGAGGGGEAGGAGEEARGGGTRASRRLPQLEPALDGAGRRGARCRRRRRGARSDRRGPAAAGDRGAPASCALRPAGAGGGGASVALRCFLARCVVE